MEQIFSEDFIQELLNQAAQSPRLRQNFDLRTSPKDTSQRMFNALHPGTKVPIHRHENTSETVVCLIGKLEEIFYKYEPDNDSFTEIARYLVCPAEGLYGIQIPIGTWHTIDVIEPSIIIEAKDGAFIG